MIPCSISYLNQLEAGHKLGPTPEFLEAFANAVTLSSTERQHLHVLAAPHMPGPRSGEPLPVEHLRAQIPDHLIEVMHGMAPHMCAYVDERWNVLACNASYADAFPGLTDVVNVLKWFFTVTASRRVMLEWESEARLTVNWFRWHMARYQRSAWAAELMTDLSADPQFAAMWEAENVDFARPQPLMHLRDASAAEPYSVNVQITDVPLEIPLQMFIGVRRPFSGPRNLLGY